MDVSLLAYSVTVSVLAQNNFILLLKGFITKVLNYMDVAIGYTIYGRTSLW